MKIIQIINDKGIIIGLDEDGEIWWRPNPYYWSNGLIIDKTDDITEYNHWNKIFK